MTTPTTNLEAWRLVHDGIAAGMTRGEIAARHDLSYQMVVRWATMSTPPQARPLGMHAADSPTARRNYPCAECGASIRPPATRCQRCEHARASSGRQPRIDALRAWAEASGHVPTVDEAARIVGMGRSRAGDLVLLAFGPDPRIAARMRSTSRRPWPPRAASGAIG